MEVIWWKCVINFFLILGGVLGNRMLNPEVLKCLEIIWKPVFHTWAKMLKKIYILGYLGGPEGVFNDQTGPILLSSYPLTHIYVHVK